MAPRRRWLVVVVLVGLSTALGCGANDASGPEDTGDSISIESVAPATGLTPGIVNELSVAVQYDLVSMESGQIMIGFNTDEVGRFAMVEGATALVTSGSGEHRFNVSIVPRDWGGDGDFKVYVNLSENPHGPTWTPLATDMQVLPLN